MDPQDKADVDLGQTKHQTLGRPGSFCFEAFWELKGAIQEIQLLLSASASCGDQTGMPQT